MDLIDADVYAAQQSDNALYPGSPGVVAVSNSWTVPLADFTALGIEPANIDGYLVTPKGHTANGFSNAGIVFLASSGDPNDPGDNLPAASYDVLSVGGESDTIDLNGQQENFGYWSGSQGGNSTVAPTYHNPLVAADGDPITGVWMYDSTPNYDTNGNLIPTIEGGWSVSGGTSLSCPTWAGIVAIIDQGLNLRGYASMDNDQVDGLTPYDDRGTTAPGDQGPMWTTATDTTTTLITTTAPDGSQTTTTTTTTSQPVFTFTPFPETGYGILGLTESASSTWLDLVQGVGVPQDTDFALWSNKQTTVTSPPIVLSTTTIPLSPNTTETVTVTEIDVTTTQAPNKLYPDITITPVNGNTGWGYPDEFNGSSPRGGFIQDMVGGPTIAEGGSVTIYSDSIDSLYFTQQPVTTVAGEPINSQLPNGTEASLEVTAFLPTTHGVDTAFNGVADTVTIDILEAGTLIGTTTAVPVNGVATFTGLSLDRIGTYEFIASSPNINPAFSNAFNITAGVPTHLAFVGQPASFWQYSTMGSSVMVAAEDVFNNVSYLASGAKITLGILSGPAGAR